MDAPFCWTICCDEWIPCCPPGGSSPGHLTLSGSADAAPTWTPTSWSLIKPTIRPPAARRCAPASCSTTTTPRCKMCVQSLPVGHKHACLCIKAHVYRATVSNFLDGMVENKLDFAAHPPRVRALQNLLHGGRRHISTYFKNSRIVAEIVKLWRAEAHLHLLSGTPESVPLSSYPRREGGARN